MEKNKITTAPNTIPNKNRSAILLMIASMAAFALADMLVKISTATASPPQVMFLLTAGGAVLFALTGLIKGESLIDRRALSPILLGRYCAEISGMVGMIMALATVPISSVGAITQAAPLLAAVGAVVFLKESIGWRRWLSILVGFLGVLLIVQPGAEEFQLTTLWAILALIGLSARDITTRLAPTNMPSAILATFTMLASLPFTAGWIWVRGEELVSASTNWLVAIPMILLGSSGYMLLIKSLRMAEVSIVMPFRYSRIIFLLALGVFVFEEKPNALMLLGAALIIVSGVYMMWREQRMKN